jgi:NAD(P) transhydrogenase
VTVVAAAKNKKTSQNIKISAQYDVIVIGTGPGGEGAAMGLSKQGKTVAVIEREKDVGGGCTHVGTIPSKALRHSVSRMVEFKKSGFNLESDVGAKVTFQSILKHTERVIKDQVTLRQGFYYRNNCPIYHGAASFVDTNTIAVTNAHGEVEYLRAKQIVIATGSRPYQPNDVNFNSSRIYDSDSILSLAHQPRSIIVYGAGVIGCEYASIFRGLGLRVDLVNTRDRLLSFLDTEVTDSLSYHFWNSGLVIRNSESYAKIEETKDGVVLHLESGKKMRADCLLFANGRTGNTDSLGLANIGLEPNSRGQLDVNEHYQTTVKNIYAVGDVIGYPSLASAAYDQGRIAAKAMISGNSEGQLIRDIPTGIYTIPEISSVGKTEQELTEQKVPYEVGRAQFKHLARAQIGGVNVGFLKLLFHRETKQLLGIHCFGERSSEIIHIGQAIMEQKGEGNTIEYFVNTTFNYPTMAEAYRVAALNGLNRLF